MFYISRQFGLQKWGVIDTDDGKEDVLTFEEIQDAVLEHGVEISGVYTYVRNKRTGARAIHHIELFQYEGDVSRMQAKLNVLQGIELKRVGDEIVSVSWDKERVRDQTFRLSDWGSSCSNYIFQVNGYHYHQGACLFTLIIDDKVKLTTKSLKDSNLRGVRLDIRELSDDKMASAIYRNIMKDARAGSKTLQPFIIDNVPRFDYWLAVHILNNGFATGEGFTHISQCVKDSYEVNRLIAKRCTSEFLSVADCNFQWGDTRGGTADIRRFITTLGSPEGRWMLTCQDYKTLRANGTEQLFRILRRWSTCNANTLLRFERYLQYFDVTPKVKDAYVRFCMRASRWLEQEGHKMGILR